MNHFRQAKEVMKSWPTWKRDIADKTIGKSAMSSNAVLGDVADTEKCLLCKNLSVENICRVLRRKKSNCEWFEESTLECGEY